MLSGPTSGPRQDSHKADKPQDLDQLLAAERSDETVRFGLSALVFGHAADHTLVSHRHRNEEVSADDEPEDVDGRDGGPVDDMTPGTECMAA